MCGHVHEYFSSVVSLVQNDAVRDALRCQVHKDAGKLPLFTVAVTALKKCRFAFLRGRRF
jgi:hypothetical protein